MFLVQICHMGDDGDAAYRIHEPSRFLGQLPHVTTVDCHFAHSRAHELAQAADLLVLQFVNDWDWLTVCRNRRAKGQITLFEANDDFFDLQTWNPIVEGWSNRLNQELYLQLIREADAVQTSSATLAQRWRQLGARDVVVFENHLVHCPPLTTRPDRPLTIGWAGSPGHFADWLSIAPALSDWLSRNPQVRLGVMTNELARTFFDLPADRYRFTPFGSLEDYYRFLETLDIGIAPLLPTRYNQGRSDVKFLEYASRGVVGLYSKLAPYVDSVEHQKTGFLFESSEDLTRGLDRLVQDEAFRDSMRTNAHTHVSQHRLLGQNIQKRRDWYLNKLGTRPRHSTRPEIEGAQWENGGRYGRLEAGTAETLYLESMGAGSTTVQLAKVEQALSLQPTHYGLTCQKGLLLNDLGKAGLAREVLDAACQIQPELCRAWAELGRSWFRLGETEKAGAALQHSLTRNPNHVPTLQYALRLGKHSRLSQTAMLARDCLKAFPFCYPLGFLCVEVLPRDQVVEALSEVLQNLEQTLQPFEKKQALAQTRALFDALGKQGWRPQELDQPLAWACRLFPQSISFWKLRGDGLMKKGGSFAKEGFRCWSKAAQLTEIALVSREEWPQMGGIPWEWQFAAHIDRWTKPGQPETSPTPPE